MFAGCVAAAVFAVYRQSPPLAYVAELVVLLGAISSVPEIKQACLTARWAGLGALLISAILSRRIAILKSPGLVIPVFLGSLMAVSAWWSIDPRLTIERGGTVAVLFAVVSVDLAPRLMLPGPRRSFTHGVSAVVPLVVAASLAYWIVDAAGARVSGELRGVLENANALGLILALAYPFLIARIAGERFEWVWLAVIAVGSATVLALSSARTGLVALLVAIAVLEIGRRRGRALVLQVTLVILTFGLAALIAAWPSGAGEKVPSLTSTTTATRVAPPPPPTKRATVIGTGRPPGQSLVGSLTGGRDESWAAAAKIVAKRPVLGFGFGVGDELFARYPKIARFTYFEGANPGSAYLTLAMELGAVGAVLFLAPLIAAAILAIVALRRRPLTAEEAVFPAVLAAGLVAAVFETILSSAGAPWSLLVWLAGVVVLLEARQRWLQSHRLDEKAARPVFE